MNKETDYSEVVQGGQGRDPEQMANECLLLGSLALIALIGLGGFLICKIIELGQ